MSTNKRSVCGIQRGKAGCEMFCHWGKFIMDCSFLGMMNQSLKKQCGPASFQSANFGLMVGGKRTFLVRRSLSWMVSGKMPSHMPPTLAT